MNEVQSLLNSSTGGIVFYRVACWEVGPDWYYLFKWELVEMIITNEKFIFTAKMIPSKNRFTDGKWVDHETDPSITIRKSWGDITVRKISDDKIYVKLDGVADLLFYRDPLKIPDSEPFADFPKRVESLFE